MKKIYIISIIISAIFLSNCGTYETMQLIHSDNPYLEKDRMTSRYFLFRRCEPSHFLHIPHYYSGTKREILCLLKPCSCGWDAGEMAIVGNPLYIIRYPFFLLDLPLSMIADTVMLPIMAVKQDKYGDIIDPPYIEIGMVEKNADKQAEYFERGISAMSRYYPSKRLYEQPYVEEETIRLLANYYSQKPLQYRKALYYYDHLLERETSLGYGSGQRDVEKMLSFCYQINDVDMRAECYEKADDFARRSKRDHDYTSKGPWGAEGAHGRKVPWSSDEFPEK